MIDCECIGVEFKRKLLTVLYALCLRFLPATLKLMHMENDLLI